MAYRGGFTSMGESCKLSVLKEKLRCNTLGILKVVGHRQSATAIQTTCPGGVEITEPMDGKQSRFKVEKNLIDPYGFAQGCEIHRNF